VLKILNITKALSDENRLRAIMMLSGGELCVCQIIQMLGLAPSTVSKHMSILRQAGLVQTRKDGRWMHYRLADNQKDAVCEILEWLKKHLEKNAVVKKDIKQLKHCRKLNLDDKNQQCKG
jgi:ArsR family transcriptional regulator